MNNQLFYAGGLNFSCTRCSSCCRFESGYVYLTKNDLRDLAAKCKMTYTQFVKKNCRWIPSANDTELLSLREKPDYDCIFWDSGCSVYDSRPLQCRTFPFWPGVLKSRESWVRAGHDCPGINSGKIHSSAEISELLKSQADNPVITRETLIPEGA